MHAMNEKKNMNKKKQIWLPKSKKNGRNRMKSIEEDKKSQRREKNGRENLEYLKND